MTPVAHCLAGGVHAGSSLLVRGVRPLSAGGWAGVPTPALTAMSVSSLCPGQQAAAAHLRRARAGGQDLRLLAVPTEVLLPDGAAGQCTRPPHTPLLVLFGVPPDMEGAGPRHTPAGKAPGGWMGLVGLGPVAALLVGWRAVRPPSLAGESRTVAAELRPGVRRLTSVGCLWQVPFLLRDSSSPPGT